jgi:hypothetical protein
MVLLLKEDPWGCRVFHAVDSAWAGFCECLCTLAVVSYFLKLNQSPHEVLQSLLKQRFIAGFFLAAIPWYVGAFILICVRVHDYREKPGYVACTIAVSHLSDTIIQYYAAFKIFTSEIWGYELFGIKLSQFNQPCCVNWNALAQRHTLWCCLRLFFLVMSLAKRWYHRVSKHYFNIVDVNCTNLPVASNTQFFRITSNKLYQFTLNSFFKYLD